MGKAIPSQHPAVVLRSSYTLVRALLAIAMIAVVGLTIAVVIVANDGDEISGTTSARPIESINYGGFNPATGRPETAPLPQRDAQAASGTTRYDGGPDEGTRGSLPGQPSSTRYDGGPEEGTRGSRQSSAASSSQVYVNPSTGYAGTRYDDGPEEDTGGPTPCCAHRP